MQTPTEYTCERCGEHLDPETLVMLELDNTTGLYVQAGTVPADHVSQGGFYFGKRCAAAVLKAGGINQTIGARAPLNRPRKRHPNHRPNMPSPCCGVESSIDGGRNGWKCGQCGRKWKTL